MEGKSFLEKTDEMGFDCAYEIDNILQKLRLEGLAALNDDEATKLAVAMNDGYVSTRDVGLL